MPIDITDLRSTIIPRSDQLNTDQILGTEKTITVLEVSAGNEEQPVIIHYHGEEGRPFKPGKTVRKILLFAWGDDGRQWVGKSMTLYADETVRFGGMAVGGIRVSALSHIPKEISISLTATKGKKAMHTIKVLKVVTLDQVLKAIDAARTREDMTAARKLAQQLIVNDDVTEAQTAYNAKMAALRAKAAPPAETRVPNDGPTTAQVMDMINKSTTGDQLEMAAGFIEGVPADQQQELRDAVEAKKKAVE